MARVISEERRRERADEHFLGQARRHRVATATLVIAMVALFGRLMTYPLQHDEQFYVSAGVLFSPDGLYRGLGFSHLPNLPILLHLLYSLPIGAYYLLVARFVIFAAWVAAIAAVILLGKALSGEKLAIALMITLLLVNPLFLGATGMAATNNFIPVPFALFGLLAFLKGLETGQPKQRTLAVSGLFLALAAGFKINYAVLILPFAVTAFLIPARLKLTQRMRQVVLPIATGGIVGALPTLFFLARDPRGLLAHVVTFHRGPQISYWHAHPNPVDPKIIDIHDKVVMAEQLWLSGRTMVLVIVLVFLSVLFVSRAGTLRIAVRRAGWRIWLIAAVTILAVMVSFPPTPAFPQYFTLPIPFAIALLAALHGQLSDAQRASARPLLIAAIALSALTGIPALLPASAALVAPRKWTGMQVHADALRIAKLVDATRSTGPFATLGPLYALEGGNTVYSQLGLGPFVYRAADYIPTDQRPYFSNPISPTTIIPLLQSTCPAAVLVGLEGDLDTPLARFARDAHYLPQQIMLHAAEQDAALLLVRPAKPAGICGQAPEQR
jgi:hypothetical protein